MSDPLTLSNVDITLYNSGETMSEEHPYHRCPLCGSITFDTLRPDALCRRCLLDSVSSSSSSSFSFSYHDGNSSLPIGTATRFYVVDTWPPTGGFDFCQACGMEVPASAEACPGCGSALRWRGSRYHFTPVTFPSSSTMPTTTILNGSSKADYRRHS